MNTPTIFYNPTVIFPDEANPNINIIQNGWTPQFANVDRTNADGSVDVVQKIINWTGGFGNKPRVNIYVGANGLVSDILLAIPILIGAYTAKLTTIAKLRLSNSGPLSTVLYITDKGKEGYWRYAPDDVTSQDNTGTVVVSADGRRYKRVFNGDIKIMWFTDGDGVIDNTIGIQAAFDDAEKIQADQLFERSCVIDFGEGNFYTTTSSILITAGHTTIKGRSFIQNNHNGDCFIISTRKNQIRRFWVKDLQIRGLNLTGNAITFDHYGLNEYFHTIDLTGLNIFNFYSGIRTYDLLNNREDETYLQKLSIVGCNINNNIYGMKGVAGRGVFQLILMNNYINQNQLCNIEAYLHSGYITANIFEDSPLGLVINSTAPGSISQGFTIEGNYFEGNDTMAISVSVSSDFKIGRNYFDSTRSPDINKRCTIVDSFNFTSDENHTFISNCTNAKVSNPLRKNGFSQAKNVDEKIKTFFRDAAVTVKRNSTSAGVEYTNPITGLPTGYVEVLPNVNRITQRAYVSFSGGAIPAGSKLLVNGLFRQKTSLVSNVYASLRFNDGAAIKDVRFANITLKDKWVYWEVMYDVPSGLTITSAEVYFYFQDTSGGFNPAHITSVSEVGYYIVDDYEKLNEAILIG